MIEFKGSHFEREVILWGVRWYVAYPISYRQLEEMMDERGVEVDHSTLNRLRCSNTFRCWRRAILRAQASGRTQLADGRDLCEGQGRLEVPVQSGRQGRRHSGLPTDRQTGLQSRASFSAQGDKM